MTKKEFYEVFRNIYNVGAGVKVCKSIVVNFSVPKAERDFIFAYSLMDNVFNHKGEFFYYGDGNLQDDGAVLSFNPKLLKMSDECIRNTIAHELVHTVKGCDDHNAKFLKVGKKYFELLKNSEYPLENPIEFIGTQEESDLLMKL
jgi:hypothetical protein